MTMASKAPAATAVSKPACASFLKAQLHTILSYIETQRSMGDTRDDDTLASLWIQRYAEAFRNSWMMRPSGF